MRICRLTFLFGALAVVTAFFFVGCSKKTEPVTEPGVAVETPPAEAREIEAEPTTDATLASSADEEELIELKPLEYDKDTLFLWRCDGATTDEKGVASTEGSTEYDDGIFDRAMVCNDENHPSYPANDVANASEGTIEFWFKPTLDRAGDTAREQWCFVELGFRFNNGVIIVVDGLNNYRAIFWGDNPATAEVERNWETGVILHNVVSWKAGEWLHIATTWDASGAQTLYLNGEQVDSINNGVYISDFASDSKLTINSRREPARGLIDEFRVSKVARSASEIAKDYKRGYDPDRRVDVKRPLERRPSASVSNGPFRVRACEGGAEIVGLNGDFSDAELVIPETVVVKSAAGENLDAPVVQIAERAFRQRKSLTSVVLPASVTKIGSYAFSDCSSLASVELPDGLTEIGGYAFSMCKSLETIALPKGLKKIGKWAFSGCEALTAIELPEGATEIEENTFSRCKSLKSVALSKETTEIDDSAFYNCESLTSIAIPDGVTKIGDYAFYGCDLLAKVAVPTSVAKLGQDAFPTKTEIMRGVETASETEGASESSADVAQVAFKARTDYKGGAEILGIDGEFVGGTLVIPETVPLKNNWDEEVETPVKKIGGYAFSSNKSLRSVFIPKGTEVIDESAFSGCKALTSVKLPDGLKNIRIKAFADCDSLETVWVPESVETLAKSAFPKTTEIKRGIDPDYDAAAREIAAATKDASDAEESLDEDESNDAEEPFDENEPIADVEFEEDFDSSGDGAVIKGINGEYSGGRIVIPERSKLLVDKPIVRIGSAFENCEKLKSIVLSKEIRYVNNGAFEGCSALTHIDVDEDNPYFRSIKGILFTKDGKELVVYPPGRKALKYVVPPEVTRINFRAFCSCDSLETVVIHKDVEFIGGNLGPAFYKCKSLKSVIVDEKNAKYKMIDGVLFSRGGATLSAYLTRSGDEYVVPEDVRFIERSAFVDAASLKTIVLPKGITSISDSTFKGCESLTTINIPEGVKSIGLSAFYSCRSLKSVVLPESLTDIYYHAFSECESLESIVIPNGVAVVRYGTFAECDALTSVALPEGLKVIEESAFSECESLESIDIPEGVAEIAARAFYGCKSLSVVNFPGSLKKIDWFAFADCDSLKTVWIPESVEEIAENAFPETTEIKRGVDPDVATSVETTEAEVADATPPGSDSSIIPLFIEDPTEPTCEPAFSFWGRQVTEASTNVDGVEITEIRITQPGTPFPPLVEIPESLFILAPDGAAVKLPVVGIRAAAFADCEGLEQVSIPPNVFIDDLVAAQKSVQLIMGVAECASETGEGATAFRARACDGGAEIIGFDGAPGETVVVPATIVVKNDSGREEEVPVVKIGEEAFKGCFAARVVALPDGLREISDGALKYLFSLESIALSDDNPNFKLVDDVFFTKDGKTLIKYLASKTDEEYVVPAGVVEIDDAAFTGNMSLTTIKLSDELEEIGDGAFANCPALGAILLSDDNPRFKAVDGVLFTKDGKTLIKYPAGKKDGDYVVPAGVVRIDDVAFVGNTALTTITLPDELEEIGDGAFANCPALGAILLSDDNPRFKLVDGVLFTKDGKTLVKYPACKKDEEYVVPPEVVEIAVCAFDESAALATIELPKGLLKIGESAFADCGALKSIDIPEGVSEIEEAAFLNCKSLETISFPKGLSEIDDFAFNGCGSLNVDSLVLPEGLKRVGDFAFARCLGSAPTLPDGVTIGQAPFPASEAPCEPVEQ